MNAAELMKRVLAYGADAKGIGDRFMGSDELYQTCFADMIDEKNVELLERSMEAGDYPRAFEAAHALKGLSGNLGLTPYYEAICALVESLRAKNYANADEEYREVAKQFETLKSLLSDAPAPQAEPAAPEKTKEKKRERRKPDKFVLTTVALLAVIVAFIMMLFGRLTLNYENNVTVESAGHLVEINYQLQQYIEDRIETDWMIAYTVAGGLSEMDGINSEEKLLRVLRNTRDIWKAAGITVYTDSGGSFDADGAAEANDLASERVYAARRYGSVMHIVESNITYTVPIETTAEYKGSRIVAVSVIKKMKTFLDDMDFSSFDDSAYMYLCDSEGKVISRLENSGSSPAFNVMALFNGDATPSITDPHVTSKDLLTLSDSTAFIINHNYVVSTPINTRGETLRLIYFVPEMIVNRTMDAFSRSVTTSSLIVIVVFSVCALIMFVYIAGVRRKQFDKALLAREHMFDLLVKRSHTAFGLFELNKQEPAFISINSVDIVGNIHPGLYKTGNEFSMRGESGETTPTLNRINESMRSWNGRSDFRSGFILNTEAVPPNYFEIQLYPISGQSDEYVGIAQDVTLLHERETVTKNALEMAERANEAKTRFLSNMSHDIRTPMNAIVNMADFAIEDMSKPDLLREHLKTIRESSDHLLLLINDILDMSRIESGKAVIESNPFDLKAELDRLKAIAAPLCLAKNQTLITDFAGVRTAHVLGDRVKFSQILMNLLSNAVKFTPKGGAVRFTAKEEPSIRDDYTDMRFMVEDTGIGISKEFIPHVFEPFTREDAKRVSGVQGTGLGLSICHSYVTAMGGVIKCESEEGEGTTFTVELFFEKTASVPPPKPEATAWDVTPFIGKRCLLCEDNPTNQRIAKTVLERLGFIVEVAGDGRQGLMKFEKSRPGHYDVIYMDIQMPVMDGYEAAAAIRSCQHEQAREIPIIAMTANVFIEDIEKARLAGMDGHVGKPITTQALTNETNTVFGRKRRTTI